MKFFIRYKFDRNYIADFVFMYVFFMVLVYLAGEFVRWFIAIPFGLLVPLFILRFAGISSMSRMKVQLDLTEASWHITINIVILLFALSIAFVVFSDSQITRQDFLFAIPFGILLYALQKTLFIWANSATSS